MIGGFVSYAFGKSEQEAIIQLECCNFTFKCDIPEIDDDDDGIPAICITVQAAKANFCRLFMMTEKERDLDDDIEQYLQYCIFEDIISNNRLEYCDGYMFLAYTCSGRCQASEN